MSLDKGLRKRLHKGYRELAGMLKEQKSGTLKKLKKIRARFCLQEGLKKARADEYIELFEESGLIKFIDGRKKWVYNSDAEWELFKVNI